MDKLQQLRKEWKTATPQRRIIIEAIAKELKEKKKKEHKCSPSPFRSSIEGNFFVFYCYCGVEIGRDFLTSHNIQLHT